MDAKIADNCTGLHMEEVHVQIVHSLAFGGRGCFFSSGSWHSDGSQMVRSICCPVVDLRSGDGITADKLRRAAVRVRVKFKVSALHVVLMFE